MLEKEMKLLFDSDKYYELKSSIEKNLPSVYTDNFIQINYYYDTEDYLLEKSKNTLRVRQKGENLKLQYKYKKLQSDGINICEEYERTLDKLPMIVSEKLLPMVSDARRKYRLIGMLVTQRSNYYYKSVVVSFDMNFYLGICDYELEIEFEDYNDAREILSLLKVDMLIENIPSKYSRFIKLLNIGEKHCYV